MIRQSSRAASVCTAHIGKSRFPKQGVEGLSIPYWQLIPAATVANLKPPVQYRDMIFPERRKLRMLEKVPISTDNTGRKPPKMEKRLIDLRGPELIHNKLIYKMYGIRALQGGNMRHGHNEMVRFGIMRKIDEKRMFAVWRIDAPWKPKTKKGIGRRMGGGKGNIDEYITPVKAGRIIIELAGHLELEEAEPILTRIAHKLPFKAEFVTHEMLEAEEGEERGRETDNLNPFSFKHCLDNNMLGSHKWAGKYDFLWYGKYH